METSLSIPFDLISKTGVYIAQSYESDATRAVESTVRNFASLSWSAKALESTNIRAIASKRELIYGDSKMLHPCVSTAKAANVSVLNPNLLSKKWNDGPRRTCDLNRQTSNCQAALKAFVSSCRGLSSC
jgi:hypothetical protein